MYKTLYAIVLRLYNYLSKNILYDEDIFKS